MGTYKLKDAPRLALSSDVDHPWNSTYRKYLTDLTAVVFFFLNLILYFEAIPEKGFGLDHDARHHAL